MDIYTHVHYCREYGWDNDLMLSIINTLRTLNISAAKISSSELRLLILEELQSKGWSSKVKLSYKSNITITAVNGYLALCLQTGNISRFYADLLKLQYLYHKGNIKAAIYILPTRKLAKLMGSNLAYFERFVDELNLFAEIITVPLFVIGLN